MSRLSQPFLKATSTSICLLLIFVVAAQAQSTTGPEDSAAMSERIQQLETKLQELKSEMAALKSSGSGTSTAVPAAVPQSNLTATSTAAESAKMSLASILGPTSVSGFIDVYYG